MAAVTNEEMAALVMRIDAHLQPLLQEMQAHYVMVVLKPRDGEPLGTTLVKRQHACAVGATLLDLNDVLAALTNGARDVQAELDRPGTFVGAYESK